MSAIHCYIIDDEFRSIRLIESMLKDYFPEISVIGTHTDPRSALVQLRQFIPDLLFLDIHLPEMDGFSFLEALPHDISEVIFITAYQEYALRAFDVHAIGYLTKPIQTDKFISCVSRAIEHIQLRKQHNLQKSSSLFLTDVNLKLTLHDGKESALVDVNRIVFAESQGNYTRIYLQDGRQQVICKQLGKIQQELPSSVFCRIHHQYLINLYHVISYTTGLSVEVKMSNGIRLPVSRRQKKHFFDCIQMLFHS